jgi:tryptophan-rich sensory protein
MASEVTGDRRRTPSDWMGLLPFLLAVAVVAALGGWAAGSAGRTYRALELPGFAPPGWVFGPVWTVLYLMIAVSAWLVWRKVGWDRSLTLWVIQLLLNLAWTPLFFGAGLTVWALVDIVVLLVLVAATLALFRPVSGVAAWLLVPYLGWVGFATALTFAIWRLN